MKKLVLLFSLMAIIGINQLAIAQNIVSNCDFELGSTEWKPFSQSSGSEPAAFDSWLAWTISGSGSISTRLSDEHVAQGSYSGHVRALSHGDAIFQYADRTSGTYTLSAWIYVVSGNPIIGIGYDNGLSSVYSDPIYPTGQWEYISITGLNITAGQSGPAIKAVNTSSEFYVDALWLNLGDTSESPYDPSTGFEPGTIGNGIVVPEGFNANVISIAKPGYYYKDLAINPNNELITSVRSADRIPCHSYIYKINADGSESLYASTCIQGPDAIAFPNTEEIKLFLTDSPGYYNKLFYVPMPEIGIATTGYAIAENFVAPVDIAFSPNDYFEYIYVAEFYEGKIYKVNINNGSKIEFASGFSFDLNNPPNNGYWLNIAFDSEGNLFVSDSGRKTIYKISPNGENKTVFASGFSIPIAMAFSSCGYLYVADFGDGTIYSISPEGTVAPFASGIGKPISMAIDQEDNMFVLDVEEDVNRKIIKISGHLCDNDGPYVYNIKALPTQISSTAIVTALIDDTATGDLNIMSAQCAIEGGPQIEMVATDGYFDESIEEVTADIIAPSIPGLYEICVRGYDEADNIGEPACTLWPVYDPEDGFVTGGGWIDSPENAYQPNPELTGKAYFGFISKYKKGATEPDGQAEFKFQMANMNFHSDTYDWLVITGSDYAKFKGEGLINEELAPNKNTYKFLVWAGDNTSCIGLDTFRIKIWYEIDETEIIVYDNGQDTEIEGGNILVHTK